MFPLLRTSIWGYTGGVPVNTPNLYLQLFGNPTCVHVIPTSFNAHFFGYYGVYCLHMIKVNRFDSDWLKNDPKWYKNYLNLKSDLMFLEQLVANKTNEPKLEGGA